MTFSMKSPKIPAASFKSKDKKVPTPLRDINNVGSVRRIAASKSLRSSCELKVMELEVRTVICKKFDCALIEIVGYQMLS